MDVPKSLQSTACAYATESRNGFIPLAEWDSTCLPNLIQKL